MQSEPTILRLLSRCGSLVVAVSILGHGAQALAQEQVYAINQSTVTFSAQANVRALTVHGATSSGRGTVTIEQRGDGSLGFQALRFSVPVKSIKTGMSLRDEHMYHKIFQAASGEFPDIQFTSTAGSCQVSAQKKTCVATGTLTIAGKSRDQTISVLVSKQDKRYRATGETSISLSRFDIPRPRQFGVTVKNDVRITVDITTQQVL